jgi:hypothetical protein
MDINVGATDKSVRTIIGAIAGVLSLAILAGQLAVPVLASPILGIVALMMLGTAATGSCPVYSVLGMSTCPRNAGP